MSLEKVIAVAEGEIGERESPEGSNRVKYWEPFGPEWQGQPWCVAYLYWVFHNAGEGSAFIGGGQTASCGIMLRWYREMGQTVPVAQIQRGDIVILNFSGTQDTQHCGLVTDVAKSSGRILYIVTVEGNTGIDSQSNGGMVCRKTRYPRQVVGVCRPKYKPEEVKPVDDVTGHWAEKAIRWELDSKISTGYPDGSYKPDNPITRAEDATKNYRLYSMTEDEMSEMRKEIARLREEVSGLTLLVKQLNETVITITGGGEKQ